MEFLRIALLLVVALGILNVWLLRAGQSTAFRGGDAHSLREEFASYGLPVWFMVFIGALKVGLALLLLAAIWLPHLAAPAAIALGVLMLGALAMHLRVHDPLKKSFPALAVLFLCLVIVLL